MSNDTFANLALELIVASPTNSRKNFDATKLQELADSIQASGVHQPVLVRPLPASRVEETSHITRSGKPLARATHELVCGERRYRASLLAGAASIPAMVRHLTDDQVREIQIIENLQRDDLTELEEAEGYEQLIKHSALTADQVGAKIGKSRSYVYARLKLLDMSHECKQAMRDGQLDASRALLIARIPDSALQAKALTEATTPNWQGNVPSVRDFQTWLQANVMLRLDKAIFKIADSRLVTSAGPCTTCPKRTGANTDLFADVSSADICTDPSCYHTKEEAHRTSLRKKAEAKGMRIVEGDEAEDMLYSRYSNTIEGYTSLGQVRNDITLPDGTTGHTMRELLGADAPGAILFEHPHTKELIEAVPEDEAQGVLLAKGLLRADDAELRNANTKATAKQLEAQIKQLQAKVDRELLYATDRPVLEAIQQGIRTLDADTAKKLLGPALLRGYVSMIVNANQTTFGAMALGYVFDEGLSNDDKEQALQQFIRSTDHANLHRAAAICMMEEEHDYSYEDTSPLVREHLAAACNIDTKAIAKEATKGIRAKYDAEIKAIQAQIDAQKTPAPNAPAAQATTTRGGAPSDGAKPKLKPAAAARNPKMSAEEATSGIAAAMQGIDRAASANAVAPPEAPQGKTQAGLAIGFVVGQRVRVTTVSDLLGATARKWAGKEGNVAKTNVDHDPDFFDVTFKGRTGGIATFRTDQLEGVAT